MIDVAHPFNPPGIITGGGASSAGELLWGPVRETVRARAMTSCQRGLEPAPAASGGAELRSEMQARLASVLPGTVVNGCEIIKPGTKCQGADLTMTRLIVANLSGADLSDAKLFGANLSAANLTGANLEGADLTGAVMPDGTPHP